MTHVTPTLHLNGPCITPDGPGLVRKVVNATHWQPAWVTVELADGRTSVYQGSQVRPA